MEEVCKVGHKKLQKNIRGWRTFLKHEMFFINSRCRSLATVRLKSDNFMQIFGIFIGVPICARCFSYAPEIWAST